VQQLVEFLQLSGDSKMKVSFFLTDFFFFFEKLMLNKSTSAFGPFDVVHLPSSFYYFWSAVAGLQQAAGG